MLVKPGQVFGRLKVLKKYRRRYSKNLNWFCLCECVCGNKTSMYLYSLLKGVSKSCGCLNKELARSRAFRHGHHVGNKASGTYRSWQGMFPRCYNLKSPAYKNYGGRGIVVCARWSKFENFLSDMGERPKGLTLDRRDNDKGYNPSNCHWATKSEQAVNRRTSRKLVFKGEVLSVVEWSIRTGIKEGCITKRLNMGWSAEETLTTNTRSNRRLKFRGETLTLAEWVRRTGISDSCIRKRLKLGWSVERALTTKIKHYNK